MQKDLLGRGVRIRFIMDSDCLAIRERVLRASHHSTHGHIPTSFSVIEMLWATYGVMRHDPARPDWPERDLFILSKGHASLGLYSTLAQLGYFSAELLSSFGAYGSSLGCHPDRLKVPGVEASTGSLGHGIGLAVGMALGCKILGSKRQVFTVVGDGEANEGSVWEAVMIAADRKLDNLTVLYDDNRSQVRSLQIVEPAGRFAAFGFETTEVGGHGVPEIGQALQATRVTGLPRAVICRTVKGYGCPTMSNDVFAWHRRAPNPAELSQLLEELRQFAHEVPDATTV